MGTAVAVGSGVLVTVAVGGTAVTVASGVAVFRGMVGVSGGVGGWGSRASVGTSVGKGSIELSSVGGTLHAARIKNRRITRNLG